MDPRPQHGVGKGRGYSSTRPVILMTVLVIFYFEMRNSFDAVDDHRVEFCVNEHKKLSSPQTDYPQPELVSVTEKHSRAVTGPPSKTMSTEISTPDAIPAKPLRLIKPNPRKDKVTAAICAIMKEEEANIDEWVDFNLGLGFTHIHIYDNTLLFELEQWGQERRTIFGDDVAVVHRQGRGLQMPVYQECCNLMKELGYTYVATFDVDEFLVIRDRKKYPTILDFLVERVGLSAVAFHWRVMGKAKRKTYEPVPVTKRFQMRTNESFVPNRQVKSIIHLDVFNSSVTMKTPHYLPLAKGRKYIIAKPDEEAALYHFRFKSFVEYVRKRMKGDVLFKRIRDLDEAEAGMLSIEKGEYIPNGTIFDDSAWKQLKEVAPRYKFYDDFYQIPPHDPLEYPNDL